MRMFDSFSVGSHEKEVSETISELSGVWIEICLKPDVPNRWSLLNDEDEVMVATPHAVKFFDFLAFPM